MPERIHKLQPDRTLALRGFDDLGASAALHSATPNSFKVSGMFRDPADFAVLVLYDADNFYDHPRLKYLPDFNFDGLTLTCDVRYSGLIPLDSPKFATIDWPYLDVITETGEQKQITLFDTTRAVQVDGTYSKAEATFVIKDNGMKEWDRITLWYLNLNFDYLAPKVEGGFLFNSKGAGSQHTVTVNGVAYTYTEAASDTNTAVALGVASVLGACPLVTATIGDGTAERGPTNLVIVRARRDDGVAFDVVVESTTQRLTGAGPGAVASALAAQINAVNWKDVGALIAIRAQATGDTLRIIADRPGEDGNSLAMYAVWKNENLRADKDAVAFTGGSSDATWRLTLNFTALGIPKIRLMWLTFSPKLALGAFEDLPWEATFTNWTVSGPESTKYLSVASPGSVRVEEDDSWCSYTGEWKPESGFFSEGWARRASKIGDSVTVKYACSGTHDLYLGTSLYTNSAKIGVRVDSEPEIIVDLFLQNEPNVNTRRRLKASVPAGEHSVVMRVVDAGSIERPKFFYFDFLEAAIRGDVPDALPAQTNLSPALDYSTDHTYKLSPGRVLWNFEKLGFHGPLNEYIGVFWWNQRKRVNAYSPEAKITFTGQFNPQESMFITLGGKDVGKTTWWNEDNTTIAKHFAQSINATFVGVWAKANGNVLTITSRSPKQAYRYDLSVRKDGSSSGAIAVTTPFQTYKKEDLGTWQVDPAQTPALNRGAQEWHTDMFRLCHQAGREIVVAESMELVYPPQGFAATFVDGKPVVTDVGFGNMSSTHCSFCQPMRDYQKSVFKMLADLMAGAGLTPELQLGEFLWWFFTNRNAANPDGGMAFYDTETSAAAQAALGRPLHKFRGPDDDPTVNGGADAKFLRNRLRDHANEIMAYVRSFHPNAKFELLFPYDVNHPEPAGIHNLGGRLNRFINMPAEWESKGTSNFDRMKMEALDFGAWSRNLDLARTAIDFPLQLGWPRDSVRHLVPIFRTGYPWEKEMAMADAAGIPFINLWAWDHVCIYGLPALPKGTGRSVQF